MDFMHILGQKEAIWNIIISIFERRRGPQRRGARQNSPPLSTNLDRLIVRRLETDLIIMTDAIP